MFLNLTKLNPDGGARSWVNANRGSQHGASLVKSDVDLAALLAKAAGGRNGNAIERQAQPEGAPDDEALP